MRWPLMPALPRARSHATASLLARTPPPIPPLPPYPCRLPHPPQSRPLTPSFRGTLPSARPRFPPPIAPALSHSAALPSPATAADRHRPATPQRPRGHPNSPSY
ncbi:unnamed protein product [Closterium sp. NIES-54]